MSYISHSEFKHLMSKFQAETPKGMLKEAVDVKDRGYQDNITPESPLDEEDEMEEGNAFTGQLHKHKPGEKFKVGDKTYKDTSNYDAPINEDGAQVEAVFNKYSQPLLKALTMRARNQEDVDAHDAVDKVLRTIARKLGTDETFPFMEDEMFSGSYSPKEALTYAKEMFASALEDGELDEYKFDQMYPEDPGPFEGEMEESHPGMDKWYEDFENGLQNLVKNGYIHKNQYKYFHDALDHVDPMQDYGHMPAHDAAKEFVDDLRTKNQMDADDYQWKQEHGGYDFGGDKDSRSDDADDYNDYEPDTDADYEEPGDDFDMAEARKLQERAGLRENLDEEQGDGSNMRDPEAAAKTVAEKHGAELKPLYDKYQAAYQQYIKDINNKELSKVYSALVKEFQNNAINWCGHEMLEAGMSKVQVRNLLSGYGYFEDWIPDYLDALSKELEEGSRMEEGEEDLVSKILKYVKDPDDAEHYASHPESMPSWLKHMIKGEKKQDMPGFGGTWDSLNKLKGEELNEYEQHYEIVNGQCRRYNDEGEYDVVSMHYCRYNESEEMEENIYEPLQKATGPTYIQKEDTTGRFSVLSPDERKQLKEYIESLKTIKKEISTLLEKAGKSTMMESDKAGYVKGGEIKNKKKETDTKHPATIKAKYHEPTHKQKTGGDRTNLVMKKSEMWEGHESDMDPKHEEMESKIDPKLHDVLHKVADKVISELEAAGFTRQEALMFLDHEIAEKGEEAKMDQYNPF